MLKNTKDIFSKKQKAIQDEIALKSKVDEVLTKFVKEEVIKKVDLDYRPSYTVNKGVIKIETDNKLIAQEIALRIRGLEEKLKKEGVVFRKLLI
ncbi:MAG TPA: hypothetical protein VJ046_03295 [Candidatus Paceibacterota bacterium]|nr:hypothetical protein [Candidatus Paceibacterota bacterium]